MCYAKPGPRCSGHTAAAMADASQKVAATQRQFTQADNALVGAIKERPQEALGLLDRKKSVEARLTEAKKEAEVARDAWLSSPDGIKHLRAEGDTAEADRRQAEREAALEQLKAVEAKQSEREAIKEWDDRIAGTPDEMERYEIISAKAIPEALLDDLARGNHSYDHADSIKEAVSLNHHASDETLTWLSNEQQDEFIPMFAKATLDARAELAAEAAGETVTQSKRDTSTTPLLSYVREHHMAPVADEDNAPLHNITALYPDDALRNPHHYGAVEGTGKDEMLAQLRRAQGNPDATITIYRALPKGQTHINRGDWVALSEGYAEAHLRSNLDDNHHIIKSEVPASTIWSEGNDLSEWGYDGDTLHSVNP